MDIFIRGVRWLSIGAGVLAGLGLAAALVVVCQMVAMRYFLNESTVWQTEFITYSVVASIFIGSPYVQLTRAHVNVDLVPIYLNHKARMALALFAALVSLAFALIVGWAGWIYFYESLEQGRTTSTVWALPLWIPLLALPLGMGLLALQFVADIACLLSARVMPFGLAPGDRM